MEIISINTTQNITVDYEVAGAGDRILAYIIDAIIQGAWIFFTIILLSKVHFHIASLIVLLIPLFFYHLAMEIFFNGQSVGKMALKIKVIKLDGTEPALGAYIIRWLFRIVDISLFSGVVALITIIVNGKGQRLGDIAADTTVISLSKREPLNTTVNKITDENYEVTFHEAANLNDQDVINIKRVFNEAMRRQHYDIIDELAEKVKTTLNIRTALASEEFLRTVIRDYNYLMSDL